MMYKSYIETARKMPEDKQLAFYNWLIDFALDDIEPDFSAESPEMQFALDLVFGQIKESISASIRRYKSSVENGRKGGNPNFKKGQPNPYYKKKDFNALKGEKITQDNLNYNDNVNDNYNSLGVSEEGDLPSPPPPRTEKKKKELPKGWKPVVE